MTSCPTHTLKLENCHGANFIAIDDKVGIMTTLSFQFTCIPGPQGVICIAAKQGNNVGFFHSVHGFVSMCYVCNPRPPYILILGCAWWEGIELVMCHHFYLTCLSWLYWGKDVTICWATLQWNTWNIYHIMSIIIFAINWVVCVLSAMHFHLMVHRTFVLHFIITITSQLLRYTSFATVWG